MLTGRSKDIKIKDTIISKETVWSSDKIDTEIDDADEIDDTIVSTSTTWSSQKINDETLILNNHNWDEGTNYLNLQKSGFSAFRVENTANNGTAGAYSLKNTAFEHRIVQYASSDDNKLVFEDINNNRNYIEYNPANNDITLNVAQARMPDEIISNTKIIDSSDETVTYLRRGDSNGFVVYNTNAVAGSSVLGVRNNGEQYRIRVTSSSDFEITEESSGDQLLEWDASANTLKFPQNTENQGIPLNFLYSGMMTFSIETGSSGPTLLSGYFGSNRNVSSVSYSSGEVDISFSSTYSDIPIVIGNEHIGGYVVTCKPSSNNVNIMCTDSSGTLVDLSSITTVITGYGFGTLS